MGKPYSTQGFVVGNGAVGYCPSLQASSRTCFELSEGTSDPRISQNKKLLMMKHRGEFMGEKMRENINNTILQKLRKMFLSSNIQTLIKRV